MGQRRSSEIAANISFVGAPPLGYFDEVPFPEPDVDEQTYQKALEEGSFSAGGEISYGPVTAVKVFDPDEGEEINAMLKTLRGTTGTAQYHDAPGKVIKAQPLKGETYATTLLRSWLSPGQDASGGDIVMLNVEFGINGVGK